MLLTLITIVAVIFLTGVQHTYIVIIAALLSYMYPIGTMVGLIVLAVLKWQGEILKQKLNRYIKDRWKP